MPMQKVTAARVVERPWQHPRRYTVQYTTADPFRQESAGWQEQGAYESRAIAEAAARGLIDGEKVVAHFDATA